jgi:AcrR family transcriptional regulator
MPFMLSPEWSNSELIIPSDDNRSRILDAVIETIDDAGAEAVRITMIAEAAGVSGPLVYHYFRDRRHLVATAMIERAQRAFTGRMERLTQSLAVVESTDGLIELFAELDANGLGAARQRARWDEIEARSIARHDPELLRTLADSEERMIGSLVEFFDSIRYRGWLRSDFDLRALAVLFRGISFGQVFQELDANLDAPTGEWSRVVANAFLGFFTVDVVPKVDRV